MKSKMKRSSLDITEHSTGSTYDCAPRDIHCCEQALGHSNDKTNKGTSNENNGNGNGSSGGSGNGGGSGSGSNVARRSPTSNNPFDNVLRMRDVVGNFGVNCSVSISTIHVPLHSNSPLILITFLVPFRSPSLLAPSPPASQLSCVAQTCHLKERVGALSFSPSLLREGNLSDLTLSFSLYISQCRVHTSRNRLKAHIFEVQRCPLAATWLPHLFCSPSSILLLLRQFLSLAMRRPRWLTWTMKREEEEGWWRILWGSTHWPMASSRLELTVTSKPPFDEQRVSLTPHKPSISTGKITFSRLFQQCNIETI